MIAQQRLLLLKIGFSIKTFSKTLFFTAAILILAAGFYIKHFFSTTANRNEASTCSLGEEVVPHPYLAYVYNSSTSCGVESNNQGLRGLDFPFWRDPNFFTILVLGGALAEELSATTARSSWIANELNAHYRSPNLQPFRTLNGAMTGWGLPNQNTMLHLYGDIADAVIDLDGKQEYQRSIRGVIDTPDISNYLNLTQPPRLFESTSQRAKLQYELLARFFLLPQEWTVNKREEWNRRKYKNYLQLLRSACKTMNIKFVHFLEPINKNHIESQLNSTLQNVFVLGIAELQKEKFPTYNLLDFSIEDSKYSSESKPLQDGREVKYRKVVKQIGEMLASEWKLISK